MGLTFLDDRQTTVAIIYRATGSNLVAAGGGRYVVYDGQTTWEWSRTSAIWAPRTYARTPPAVRTNPMVAFHPERGAAWMFGGYTTVGGPYLLTPTIQGTRFGGAAFGDTLEWHGAPAAP